MADRAYTVVPHTSKAVVSVNCGIQPHLDRRITEAEPGGIPARCLPQLLEDQGYGSVGFQSATERFEDRRDVVRNFGYQGFYPLESMSTRGFHRVNYLGYEDDIMLDSSRKWLQGHGNTPFVGTHLGVTGHHDHLPVDRYGNENFSRNDLLNRYQKGVHYLDSYVQNVIEQYKGSGSTGTLFSSSTATTARASASTISPSTTTRSKGEGPRIPLIIHAPRRFSRTANVSGPSPASWIYFRRSWTSWATEYPAAGIRAGPCSPRRTVPSFSVASTFTAAWPACGEIRSTSTFSATTPKRSTTCHRTRSKTTISPASKAPKELKSRRSEVLDWYARVNPMYQR